MMVCGERFIRGLRLIDEEGNNIIDMTWCPSNMDGDWVTKSIPEHHRIIGLNCRNTKGMYDTMFRLGFQVWKPNPRALD